MKIRQRERRKKSRWMESSWKSGLFRLRRSSKTSQNLIRGDISSQTPKHSVLQKKASGLQATAPTDCTTRTILPQETQLKHLRIYTFSCTRNKKDNLDAR